MSSFSFSPLPFKTPNHHLHSPHQARNIPPTDDSNPPTDSQNNSQNIPFGYNPAPMQHPDANNEDCERPSIVGASSLDDPYLQPPQDVQKSTNSFSNHLPVFFGPMDCVGGLVCGQQDSTKYDTFKNLLISSWSASVPATPAPKELLCFTAEGGSIGLVDAITAATQATNLEPVIIVLTPKWNTVRLTESLSSRTNTTVLPLLTYWQDYRFEDLAYLLSTKHDGENWPLYRRETEPSLDHFRELKEHSGDSNSLRLLFDNLGGYLRELILHPTGGWVMDDKPPSPWVQWIRKRQPVDVDHHLGAKKVDIRPKYTEPIESTPSRPFVLCIDWPGLANDEMPFQLAINSVILRCWQNYIKSSPAAQRMIICDNAHLYFTPEIKDPFSRSITRHISSYTGPSIPSAEQPDHPIPLLLLCQSPMNLPSELLDLFSFLIIHRFSSPRWYHKLQEHYLLPLSYINTTTGNPNQHAGFYVLERISALFPHQVFLYAPYEHTHSASSAPSSSSNSSSRDTEKRDETTHIDVSINLRSSRMCNGTTFGPIQRPTGPSNVASTTTASSTNRTTDTNSKTTDVVAQRPLGHRLLAITFTPSAKENKKFCDLTITGPFQSESLTKRARAGHRWTDGSDVSVRWRTRSGSAEPEDIRPLLSPSDPHPRPTLAHSAPLPISGSGYQSPPSPAITRGRGGGSAFSPFTTLNIGSGPNGSTGGVGVIGSSTPTTSSSSSAHYHQQSHFLSPTSIKDYDDTTTANLPFGRRLQQHHQQQTQQPMGSLSSHTTNESGSMSRMYTDSRDGSLGDLVDIGSMKDANSVPIGNPSQFHRYPHHQQPQQQQQQQWKHQNPRGWDVDLSPIGIRHNGGFAPGGSSSKSGVDAGAHGPIGPQVFKPSYAEMIAPPRDHNGIQRKETAILVGSGQTVHVPPRMPGSKLPGSNAKPDGIMEPLTNGMTPNINNSNNNSNGTTARASGVMSPPPPMTPPPPPPPTIYPEPFFWPLLDALEKARAQVNTSQGKAQCVRHSVVGQELPQSARARLGLTFKEYVAAAARQSIIVTGDSGDKAWIAMKDWKYPGKLSGALAASGSGGGGSSSTGSGAGHPLTGSSGTHAYAHSHLPQGFYHGTRPGGK